MPGREVSPQERDQEGNTQLKLRLCRRLDPILDNISARITMAVFALDGTNLYDRNGSTRMPSASLIKIPILLCLLDEVANGRQDLSALHPLSQRSKVEGTGILAALDSIRELSLRDLAHLMIALSDNVATNILIELLGMSRINRWCSRHSLHATRLERHMMDAQAKASGSENWTSATDICAGLRHLAVPGTFPEALRKAAMEMLADQRDRGSFAARLPPDATLAHKTGALPGLRHDAGLLCSGDGKVVLAVLADGFSDWSTSHGIYGGDGAELLGTLATEVATSLGQHAL